MDFSINAVTDAVIVVLPLLVFGWLHAAYYRRFWAPFWCRMFPRRKQAEKLAKSLTIAIIFSPFYVLAVIFYVVISVPR